MCNLQLCYQYIILLLLLSLLLLLLLFLLLTAIEVSLGGSSPYTNTKKISINIHKINNTKHSKYKYTYWHNIHTLQTAHIHTPTHYKTHTYWHNIHTLQNPHILTQYPTLQNPHILTQYPHITKCTHTHTHTLQNKLKQPQDQIHT